MSKIAKGVRDFSVEAVVTVIGWAFCLGVLGGAYRIGVWAATYFREGNSEMFGLLSALTFVWLYEHRNLEDKYNRLRDLLDR
jgi:hypothetical protein